MEMFKNMAKYGFRGKALKRGTRLLNRMPAYLKEHGEVCHSNDCSCGNDPYGVTVGYLHGSVIVLTHSITNSTFGDRRYKEMDLTITTFSPDERGQHILRELLEKEFNIRMSQLS